MATYRRDRETYRYAQSRAKAFATAEALYESASSSAFSLRGIDSHALFAWRTRWPAHQGLDRDMGRWDWEMLAASYHRRPSAFHLAIWSGNELCGLAVGRPSRSRRRLTVEYMEGSPNSIHPLKGQILELTLAAAVAYGRTLGAKLLRLSDPAAGLIAKYEALGFALVPEGRVVRYCERRIS